MKHIYRISNIGDTIVEVMIAMAVLGLVLLGAYSIANQSLTTIRDAQERTEALKLAEGQIEQLKAKSGSGTNIFEPVTVYCIGSDGNIKSTSAGCAVTNGIDYNIEIKRVNLPLLKTDPPWPTCPDDCSNHYLFTITVKWGSIHGGNNNVTLKYKLVK